jgi:hypothetical protein
MTPVRLGKHSDWVAIGKVGREIVSLAADGSIWWWRFDSTYIHDGSEQRLWLAPSRKPQKLGNIFDKGGLNTHSLNL